MVQHQRLGDIGRQQVLHPAADDLLPRVREQGGVADEVDVHAVRRDPEHQVGDGVEKRAHPRLDIRLGKWRIAFHPREGTRSRSAELDGELDERPDIVVRRAEVHEAGPQPDLAVDRRRRDPDPAVVLQRPHQPRVLLVHVAPTPTWRNGTIDSGGGPQRGSSDGCARTSS